MKEINPKHKAFAQAYIENQFIGYLAYSKVYDKDVETHYQYCKSAASTILARPEVAAYIQEKLDDNHLSVEEILKQLKYLATQKSELGSALGACKLLLQYHQKLTEKIEIKQVEYKAVWG